MASRNSAGRRPSSSRGRGPYKRTMSEAGEAFEQGAEEILNLYRERRKQTRPSAPFDWPESLLKRECYNLIQKHSRWSGRVITSIVKRWECIPEQITYAQNKFYWGILAIDPEADCISNPSLSKYAKEMLYADLHGVPPEYLIGFLSQSGNLTLIRERLRRHELDQEFLNFRKRANRPKTGHQGP